MVGYVFVLVGGEIQRIRGERDYEGVLGARDRLSGVTAESGPSFTRRFYVVHKKAVNLAIPPLVPPLDENRTLIVCWRLRSPYIVGIFQAL